MNLNAAPISTRPPTTLTVFIQSPLRGILARSPGESASRKNGSARKSPLIERQCVIASPVVDPWIFCPCLAKKLTVTGIIGQTQGIASANSPPPAQKSRKERNPSSGLPADRGTGVGSGAAVASF